MRAIMVELSDSGTYTIPGAAESEDWDEVQSAANSVEHESKLQGWEPWTDVYRLEMWTTPEPSHAYYFVGPEEDE